ncbi:uncharacterized protein TNCV_4507191 [Trichonephila clavipes]|nr:uncharacterized protein TNCV_4507191 [Trichonephila clavipes]
MQVGRQVIWIEDLIWNRLQRRFKERVNWARPRVASSCSRFGKSGATGHEGQDLLCPSQYRWQLGAEVHEQMSRSGGPSEARSPVFKPPSKLGTHLSTHCSRDEKAELTLPSP